LRKENEAEPGNALLPNHCSYENNFSENHQQTDGQNYKNYYIIIIIKKSLTQILSNTREEGNDEVI